MDLRKHIALFLLGLLGITYAQDFYVAAPSTLRLNADETIAIAYDGPAATMTVNVQDYPKKQKNIFHTNIEMKPGIPQTFKMKLNVADFPPNFLSAPVSPKLVSMNVNIRNSKKEILIPINSDSGYMFVQTDKPIYTPKERVSFRIIPLTEYGLPSTEKFQLQIKNPDKIVVDEKTFNERNKVLVNYFATHSYTFPKYPILGEWTAVIRYGYDLKHNSSVAFELREYVLPTFTVRVSTPDIILPNMEEISVVVGAEYVYGKKVNGIASFRFGVKRDPLANATFFGLKNPAGLVNGALTVYLSTKDLQNHKDIGWFPRIEGSIFVVEASVVDVATGNRILETNSKTRFSRSPFAISFKRCLSDFRPGLTSVFEADITYVGGKPATGLMTKLTAVADNGQKLKIAQSTSRSDDNGKVAFEIHPEIHHKALTLTLETTDARYAGSQAKGTYVQRAYQSNNNAYIAISRSSNARLRPEDVFSRDIHLKPKEIQNIYYLVMARGKIQRIDKLPAGAFEVQRMEFPITFDMVPNFRVIVFAHHGNSLVVDSLKIDVEKVCSPVAEVTLDPQFNLKEPGSGGKIVIRGTKDTSVGLLGVDEAVYALSRKDLLTKEKMFDRLASHDLGCGPGGGLNANAVLGNAGITILTNKFVQPHTHSCVEVKRKKRSLAEDIVGKYTGYEALCCAMGLQPDPHERICDDKFDAVKVSLEALHENCTEIFMECCLNAEEQGINGSVYFTGGRAVVDGQEAINFIDPELEEEFERQTTIRKDFRETWINFDVKIRSNNGAEVPASLPHSITTWVIQAVSLNPTHGICVSEPKKIVSFKKIFMHINLPYSIKQYEQVEVQATVFNYIDKDITVFISMYGVEGLCSGTEPGVKSERKRLYISRNSAESVTFSVIPLKVEDIPIKILALSSEGSDIIEKKLHVVPQGVKEEQNAVIRLDPTNRQKRPKRDIDTPLYSDSIDPKQSLQVTAIKLTPPIGTVPGTVRCTITAIGDPVGPAVETTLKNPDSLIQMPSGCGEQNMVRLAPTIYTMRYLKSVDKLTPERRNKGVGFIRSGFDNELKYKKADGSYSVWGNTPTSTWLTAFVMKVFCQGTEFVPIDKNVINSGVQWLIRNQERDGSYIEKHRMYHKEMMGGVEGAVSMTAFALIALEECTSGDQTLLVAKQRAIAYLESHLNTVQTPLPAAIIAYALALTNSTVKRVANDKLMTMARFDPDRNYLSWSTRNSAQDIETTGYGLLTQLLLNDMNKAMSIVNWLNTKQLQTGEFKSTQDTVIGLQALSEYAIKAPANIVNLVSNITSSRDKTYFKVLTFSKDNALELQDIKVDDPEGTLFIRTSGIGMATLAMRLRYNVLKPAHEICKFEIKETVTEVKNNEPLIRGVAGALAKDIKRRRRQANKDVPVDIEVIKRKMKDSAFKVNICLKYLGDRNTEMAIADVGIFSGFEPDVNDLEKLEKDSKHLIQKYEKSKRSIVFYLEEIPSNKDYCFSFRVYREFTVGNTQSSVIKVYDYYNPDAVCTKFYSPDTNSSLVNTLCDGGVCVCADGGCSPKKPFSEFTDPNIAARRENMIRKFCEDYDFVWKGNLQGRLRKDGRYINITFEISEVIKAGTEIKEDLEKNIRILRAHEHCEKAKLLAGVTYLILGKDPPNSGKEEEKNYRYFLDKASIIHHWTRAVESTNLNLQRDLDYVTNELKKKGCPS